MPRAARRPSHAGSWYESDRAKLESQIDAWLAAAARAAPAAPPPRAILGPHAGHRYCGHVMAHAYTAIKAAGIKRVFLLGPSHHVYGRRCWLSPNAEYETPLGPLPVDGEVYDELRATGAFDTMSASEDEAEHSLELHTPFIARAMGSQPFKLVPIMVGALSTEGEALYGALLGRYLDDPANLFVISSDFCHWGRRFSYTFHDETKGPIWKSIQWLDELGMRIIEKGDPEAFAAYQKEYRNTICGRHPIGVLLNMLRHAATKFSIAFNSYDQSSRCEAPGDSSVSYAAATVLPA
ncbi:MAG: MEMO1 family [Monoraphidium minutum]|nr:MAG: MEMO1 family [Monoraphidium minutum]